MAKYSNTIEYQLRTSLDASGITKLQQELKQVENQIQRFSGLNIIGKKQSSEALKNIREIETALNRAFNTNTGMLNIDKFVSQLSAGNRTIQEWQKSFSAAGSMGERAFTGYISRLGQIDTGLTRISKNTDKIFNTFSNTVRWGFTASIFQTMLNSLHDSVSYVKELDRSLNDIRIVTGYSANQMRQFSLDANEAAKALGQTTVAYTDAALIFAQQGFNLEDSKELAELTLKVANTTGQATDEVSSQVTAFMNGFQLSIDEVAEGLDKIAKVAAIGAADVEELMTAASKVASSANMLGVSQDQLISQMSTIISVTREAPENVGNALKTIYARLGDLKLGETLEDGTTLGNLSGTLEDIGIQVLDDTGAMRNMGDVLEDLMERWDTFDRAQQQSLANKLAGKYQYARFAALMQNENMYQEQLQESINASGSLDEMQDTYMESLAAKSKSIEASTEKFISTFLNPDDLKPFQDGLSDIIGLFTDLIDSVGGGSAAFTGLFAIMSKVFSTNMAQGLTSLQTNLGIGQDRKISAQARADLLSRGMDEQSVTSNQGQKLQQFAANVLKNEDVLSSSDIERYNAILASSAEAIQRYSLAEENLEKAVNSANMEIQAETGIIDAITIKYNEAGEAIGFNADQLNKLVIVESELNESFVLRNVGGDEDAAQKIMNYGQGIKNSLGFITNIREELNNTTNRNYKKHIDSIDQNASDFINIGLKQIEESGIENKKIINDLTDGITKLAKLEEELRNPKSNRTKKSILAEMEEEATRLGLVLEEDASRLNELYGRPNYQQTMDNVQGRLNDVQGSRSELETSELARDNFEESVEQTIDNKKLVDSLVAVSQLTFAWQSFQSLGSLFVNEDMEAGEKITQIVMNLSMTLPMLLNGMAGLKDLGSSIKTIAIAAKEAATSLGGGFLNSIKGLISGVGGANIAVAVLTTTIMAATTIYSAYTDSIEKALKREQEHAQSIISERESINKAVSSFKIAYEQYKKTGEITDELKNSATSAADAVGLLGGSALVAAGNYEALGNQIDDVNKKLLQKNANELYNSYISQEKSEAVSGGFMVNSMYDKLATPFMGDEGNKITYTVKGKEYTGGDVARKINEYEKNGQGYEAIAFVQAIQEGLEETNQEFNKSEDQVTQEIEGLNNQIQEYTDNIESKMKELPDRKEGESLEDYTKRVGSNQTQEIENLDNEKKNLEQQKENKEQEREKIQNQRETNQDTYNDLAEVLGEEKIQEFGNTARETLKASLQSFEFTDELLDGNNNSMEDIINKLKENKKIAPAFNEDYADYSDQLEFIIENTTNETLKMKGQLELLKTKVSDKIDSAEINIEDYVDLNAVPEGVSSEDIEGQLRTQLDMLIEQISAKPDGLELLASIDMTKSTEEIITQIHQLSDDVSDEELKITGTLNPSQLTDRFYEDEESIKETLKGTDFSENSFDRYAKALGQAKVEASGVLEKQKELREEYKAGKVTNQQYEESMNELLKKQNQLNDVGKDLAARNIRLNKGISDLSSSFSELNRILQNESGTSKWYNAMSQLDEIMSNILDIDIGALSNNFYTDYLGDIQRLAEGDIEVLDTLRTAAGEDIIAHMQIKGLDIEEADQLRSKLVDQMHEFQSICNEENPHIDLEADSSGFLATLNAMLEAAQITRDEATEILSSIGMEGTIIEKRGQGRMPVVKYRVKNEKTYSDNGNDLISSDIVMEPEIEWKEYDATFPVITGADYSGPGVSVVSPSSYSSSGGSSGSSGGGKKSNKKTKIERSEKEPDRYREVDTQLDAIGKDYEYINTERERLVGPAMFNMVNKECGALETEIGLLRKKQKIQQDEQKEIKNRLGKSVTYNKDGTINQSSYKKAFNQKQNHLNQTAAWVEKGGSDEEIERRRGIWEDEKKKFDKWLSDVQRYDELVGTEMKETTKRIQEATDAVEDLHIEMFNMQLDAHDTIKDLNEKLIEFRQIWSGLRSDDPFRQMATSAAKLGSYFDLANGSASGFYKSMTGYNNKLINDPNTNKSFKKFLKAENKDLAKGKKQQGKGTVESGGTGYFDMGLYNLQAINKEVDQFEQTGKSDIFGKNSKALYEAQQAAFEQAYADAEAFEKEIDNLRKSILDAIDKVNEKMEERKEQYQQITDMLQHHIDMQKMLYGDRAYENLSKLYDSQIYNLEAAAMEQRSNLAYWEDMLKGLVKGSDQWKEVSKQIANAKTQLQEYSRLIVEAAQSKLETNANKEINAWMREALGVDVDWMQSQWEALNKKTDYYLDAVNRAYEIQKLQNDYQKLLNDSDDLSIQQQITEQMNEQLGYLRTKKNLTEYDVNYAKAQLEILQKQIALEEARANKNKMKLKRDGQGNYSYVYTADESDTADKENELLDAQNNAYNLSKNQMRQTQEDSLNAFANARTQLLQIWTDANLETEERKARIEEVLNNLAQYVGMTSDELKISEYNIINDFSGMVDILLEENEGSLTEIYERIKQGNLDAFAIIDEHWSTAITNWLAHIENFKDNNETLLQSAKDSLALYVADVKKAEESTGISYGNVTSTTEGAKKATDALTQSQLSFSEQLNRDKQAILDYSGALAAYEQQIQTLTSELAKYRKEAEKAGNTSLAKKQADTRATSATKGSDTTGSGKGGNGGSGKGTGNAKPLKVGDTVQLKPGHYYHSNSYGGGPSGNWRDAVKVTHTNNGAPYPIHLGTSGSSEAGGPESGWRGWVRRSDLVGYKSGGYTGSWSDITEEKENGKLAFLHQKELVLNSSDTENILKVVSVVRNLTSQLKDGLINSIQSAVPSTINSTTKERTVTQSITINADFPNANSAQEIEKALLTLNEQALQYAYKEDWAK